MPSLQFLCFHLGNKTPGPTKICLLSTPSFFPLKSSCTFFFQVQEYAGFFTYCLSAPNSPLLHSCSLMMGLDSGNCISQTSLPAAFLLVLPIGSSRGNWKVGGREKWLSSCLLPVLSELPRAGDLSTSSSWLRFQPQCPPASRVCHADPLTAASHDWVVLPSPRSEPHLQEALPSNSP